LVKSRGKGWHGDPYKHSLASRGIKVSNLESHGKVIDGLKKIGGKLKEKGSVIKDKIKDLSTKFKTKAGQQAGNITNINDDISLEKTRNNMVQKDNRVVGETLKQGLRDSYGEAIPLKQKDSQKKTLDDLSHRELLSLVKKGKIADSGAIVLSDDNRAKLERHYADLKYDANLAKDIAELYKKRLDIKRNYFIDIWKSASTEVDNKWKEIKDNLDGSERKEIKAELKHIKEMKRLELKTTISEAEADFEYAKTIYNGIKNIYQERKKLMKQIR